MATAKRKTAKTRKVTPRRTTARRVPSKTRTGSKQGTELTNEQLLSLARNSRIPAYVPEVENCPF